MYYTALVSQLNGALLNTAADEGGRVDTLIVWEEDRGDFDGILSDEEQYDSIDEDSSRLSGILSKGNNILPLGDKYSKYSKGLYPDYGGGILPLNDRDSRDLSLVDSGFGSALYAVDGDSKVIYNTLTEGSMDSNAAFYDQRSIQPVNNTEGIYVSAENGDGVYNGQGCLDNTPKSLMDIQRSLFGIDKGSLPFAPPYDRQASRLYEGIEYNDRGANLYAGSSAYINDIVGNRDLTALSHAAPYTTNRGNDHNYQSRYLQHNTANLYNGERAFGYANNTALGNSYLFEEKVSGSEAAGRQNYLNKGFWENVFDVNYLEENYLGNFKRLEKFEENAFKEKAFEKNFYGENTFDEKDFGKNAFLVNPFEENTLGEKAFLVNPFEEKAFKGNDFLENSFDAKAFGEKPFGENILEKALYSPWESTDINDIFYNTQNLYGRNVSPNNDFSFFLNELFNEEGNTVPSTSNKDLYKNLSDKYGDFAHNTGDRTDFTDIKKMTEQTNNYSSGGSFNINMGGITQNITNGSDPGDIMDILVESLRKGLCGCGSRLTE